MTTTPWPVFGTYLRRDLFWCLLIFAPNLFKCMSMWNIFMRGSIFCPGLLRIAQTMSNTLRLFFQGVYLTIYMFFFFYGAYLWIYVLFIGGRLSHLWIYALWNQYGGDSKNILILNLHLPPFRRDQWLPDLNPGTKVQFGSSQRSKGMWLAWGSLHSVQQVPQTKIGRVH